MSPASQTGGLHVERYIGSYLISNSSRNGSREIHPDYDGCGGNGKATRYLGGRDAYRGAYVPADGLFRPPPFCQGGNGWAGVPLISAAGHRRSAKPHAPPYQQRPPDFGDGQLPLSKLALHTRGAPLILSRRYNNNGNRKQNHYQNNARQFAPFAPGRAPVAPDALKKIRDVPKENRYEYKDHAVVSRTPVQNCHLALNMDSLSVTSDESSGSAHSETCLPRIIKPRKRRKKDRKPPTNNILEKGTTGDCKLEAGELSPDSTLLSLNSYISNCHEGSDVNHNASNYKPVIINSSLLDYMKLYSANDVLNSKVGEGKLTPARDVTQRESSDPRAVRGVDDVDENESDDSSSLFEAISRCSPTVCQCRYCDPSGQIWDIDQRCYSPLLTAPGDSDYAGGKSPFADKDSLLRRSWSEPCPGYSVENLRISEYDKRSTPHRSDPNMTVSADQQDASGEPRGARSVGVIGAGRRAAESSDSPSTLDWRGDTAPQPRLVPETLFKSSSSRGVSLEVSSAIVTSLNGHRDLEIKFFSTSPPAVSEVATFVYPSRKDSENNEESALSDDNSKCVATVAQSVTVQ